MSAEYRVLPSLEVNLGTVAFCSNGRWHSFWVAEPAALLTALANPVRPSHWNPAEATLTVTVAQTGEREGLEKVFRLIPIRDSVPTLS